MEEKYFNEFLIKSIEKSHNISDILRKTKLGENLVISGLTNSAKAFFVYYLSKKLNRPILFLTSTIAKALDYQNIFSEIQNDYAEFFEPQEGSCYDQIFSNSQTYQKQLKLLFDFRKGKIPILNINAQSMHLLFNSPDFYENSKIVFEKKGEYDFDNLITSLTNLGYRRENMVSDIGEFSLRGDILDVYPINDNPVRIEFWGDEIESIRYFNVDTQKTIKLAQKVEIWARYKILLNDIQILKDKMQKIYAKQINELDEKYRESFEFWFRGQIESLENEKYFEGVEYYTNLLDGNNATVFDYLPADCLIVVDETYEVLQKCEVNSRRLIEEYEKNTKEGLALKLENYNHLEFEKFKNLLNKFSTLDLNSFIEIEEKPYFQINSQMLPKFDLSGFELSDFLSEALAQNFSVVISTQYPSRVCEILKDFEIPHQYSKNFTSDCVNIIKSNIYQGFSSEDLGFCLITDTELFNRKIKKATISKKMSKKEDLEFIYHINDLKENDLVVHSMHGIGKYIGLSQQEIDGQFKDYLTIEYANSDRLYIPAEQINTLSRYRGSSTVLPKLSKMGGSDWTNIKTKVRKAVDDIAFKLVNLYARRKKSEGFQFAPDTPWQMEMEDAFLYTETPDQLKAINDTKADMESNKAMDRLICADVGFGKTEIAIRAAFKAIMSGKQVAFLAPTTILTQQHYQVFKERFAPFAIKIELLSRFRSPKEIKNAINALKTGGCDLVIGTHRLLQKDVEFKDLGLVVIDEEHRFGVAHKEKLKEYRVNVDVISLSATPIPRTLYMSLSGVRDMSLINTPPVNRLPIKTFIGEYNPAFIKTAVNYELEREGQVYILYNRVQTMPQFYNKMKELLPNARIAFANGQMNPKELEEIIYEFSIHNFDVLICSTIIESGIDIPNANTMIICDADKFGLAQLYQLRGRIGRSERQAYAYCFWAKDKVLTQEAQNRLKAIKDFTTLGSGYKIAMRDLEIRGVGNILGASQHGHMINVGFDVYCDLLDEAVKELQGEKVIKKEIPVVDINITAFIPEDYVGSKEQKMIEYKRLADTRDLKELEGLKEEWQDRFGKIPQETLPLFEIIKLRLLASDIGIKTVREVGDEIRIFVDYKYNEWGLIVQKLDRTISRRLKYTKNTLVNAQSEALIRLNKLGLNSDELIETLKEIFYCIKNLQENIGKN